MLPALARDGADGGELEFCQWTAAEMNDLPDGSFMLIEGGGKKDESGKTEPRSLRHFPYRDASGKIDLPHLRNAISRIPQAKIAGFTADDMQTLQEKARTLLSKAEGGNTTARLEDVMDPKLLALLGLNADANLETVLAAIAKMKDEATLATKKVTETESALATARATPPGLDRFVPRADYELVMARAQASEKQISDQKKEAHLKEVNTEIDTALKAGKIVPASKDFYLATCSVEGGLEKFRDFVKTAPVIGDPSKLEGAPPPSGGDPTASDEALAIATRCGVTKDKYLASLKAA
jgi:phage I-like protein